MGMCMSSTSGVDPETGQKKKTKKITSQYPGAKRPVNAPYVPGPDEFTKVDSYTRTATKHFVTVGGGNALRLEDRPPPAQTFGGEKKYVAVTLPQGVKPGQEIKVSTPDGELVSIIVPDGMSEGSTFTVEFISGGTPAPAPPPPPAAYAPTKDEPDIPIAAAVPVPY